MAGQGDLLIPWIRQATAYDDEALVAIANRGLLRRAKKDFKSLEEPIVEGSTPETPPVLAFEDARIELAEPLPRSRCDCPASGACRHLLTAILWLRSQEIDDETIETGEPESPSFDPVEIDGLDDATLRSWAGSALFRKGLERVSRGVEFDFEPGERQLVIHLPTLNQTVRWLAGRGLEGMLCSCHETGPCLHRIVALLAWQLDRGRREPVVFDQRLEASSGSPRTRAEIVASTRALLRELFAAGLSRLSENSARRLRSLAVSAHGVDLPRLERALAATAEEADLHARKRVEADPEVLFSGLARLKMLCLSLKHPAPGTVGQHRGDFVEMGTLQLLGIGANAWTTRSGFLGLTTWFYAPALRRWFSWTDTRPRDRADFDPVTRFTAESPWSGLASPEEAARSELQLNHAFATPEGRLSGRAATRALKIGDVSLERPELPVIADWIELEERSRALFGHGLSLPPASDYCVLLRPGEWDAARLDPATQRIERTVRDANGRSLRLVRPLGGADFENRAALQFRDLSWPEGSLVFGRLLMEDAGPAVLPLSILSRKRRWYAGLDHGATGSEATLESASRSPDPTVAPALEASALADLFNRLDDRLLAIAESGLRGLTAGQSEDLAECRQQLQEAGLSFLPKALARMEGLESKRRHGLDRVDLTQGLLTVKYLLDLHRRQLAMESAMAE